MCCAIDLKDGAVKYGHSIIQRPFPSKDDIELQMENVPDDSQKTGDARTSGVVFSCIIPLVSYISRMRNNSQ
jgi:hypothetical protein